MLISSSFTFLRNKSSRYIHVLYMKLRSHFQQIKVFYKSNKGKGRVQKLNSGKVSWNTLETLWKYLWNTLETSLKSSWNLLETCLKHLKNIETTLKYYWSTLETFLKHHGNTHDTHLKLPWNLLEISFNHPWYIFET